MSIPMAAYGALEITLNRYMAGDDAAMAQCKALAGKSLQVDLNDLGVTLVFIATSHGFQVVPNAEAAPDVRLQGGSDAFARIFMAGAEDGLMDGGVRIEGDVGVARQFARLFSSVDFDIGDWLDERFGPVPAQLLTRGLHGARSLARRATDTLVRDAGEYFREETRDVIGNAEHAEFADVVAGLRDDVDRLAARVRRLTGN